MLKLNVSLTSEEAGNHLDCISITVGEELSQCPCNTVKHAVFPRKVCAPSTEYIDPNIKLKYQFVLDWVVSNMFAPLPLRMSPHLNYASILSSNADAAVN